MRVICCHGVSLLTRLTSGRVLPHFGSAGSFLLGVAALVLSLLVVLSCDFTQKERISTGIFFTDLNNNGVCEKYPSQTKLDVYWIIARLTASGAVLAGFCTSLLLCFEILCVSLCNGYLKPTLFSAAQFSQGLTFLFFASKVW